MSNERCMICLNTIQDRLGYKIECSPRYCKNYVCIHCHNYIRIHISNASFPLCQEYFPSFRCSLNCLINTTINRLDHAYQQGVEKDFIKKQKKLLESIYTTNTLNNFLYKDVITIVNEYIL